MNAKMMPIITSSILFSSIGFLARGADNEPYHDPQNTTSPATSVSPSGNRVEVAGIYKFIKEANGANRKTCTNEEFLSQFISVVSDYDTLSEEQSDKWYKRLSEFGELTPENEHGFFTARNLYFGRYRFSGVNSKKLEEFSQAASKHNSVDREKWRFLSTNTRLILANIHHRVSILASINPKKAEGIGRAALLLNVIAEEDGGYFGYIAFLVKNKKIKEIEAFSKIDKEHATACKSISFILNRNRRLVDVFSALYGGVWGDEKGHVLTGFRVGYGSYGLEDMKARSACLCAFYAENSEQADFYLNSVHAIMTKKSLVISSKKRLEDGSDWLSRVGTARLIAMKWGLSKRVDENTSIIDEFKKAWGKDVHVERIISQIKSSNQNDLPARMTLDKIFDLDKGVKEVNPFDGSGLPSGEIPVPPKNWKSIPPGGFSEK